MKCKEEFFFPVHNAEEYIIAVLSWLQARISGYGHIKYNGKYIFQYIIIEALYYVQGK